MKKLIFTLFCVAATMQFSFAQRSASARDIPNVLQSTDSVLFNSGFDTTLLSFCIDPNTFGGYSTVSDGNSGCINGSNDKGDKAKLEKYFIHGNKEVVGIAALIWSVYSDGSPDTASAVLYDKSGKALATSQMDLATLAQNAIYSNGASSGGQFTLFNITSTPIYTADSIYVGITMPFNPSDSLAVACTPIGCDSSTGALSYDVRSDGSLHTTKSNWSVNIDYLIFPVYYFDPNLSTSTGVTLNGLTINAAYPNPTNSSVNLNYAVDHSTSVRVEIYNALGQQVKAQSLGNQNPGKYTQNIDMSHFAKGTYFYSIITDNSRLFGQVEVQ